MEKQSRAIKELEYHLTYQFLAGCLVFYSVVQGEYPYRGGF